jgi:uroporphyrinogen III methyltransferase/synthase
MSPTRKTPANQAAAPAATKAPAAKAPTSKTATSRPASGRSTGSKAEATKPVAAAEARVKAPAVLPKSAPAAASKAARAKAPTKAAEPKVEASAPKVPAGTVAFVGAGPGDPSLLTLRAVDLLREAEAVVLGEQAREQYLTFAPTGVEVIDGAFDAAGTPLAPAARAKAITGAAKGGRRVVRLVDGDPATHPSLAEEAAACVKVGCEFELVPGVPALSAVPAFAGVPTRRMRRSTGPRWPARTRHWSSPTPRRPLLSRLRPPN